MHAYGVNSKSANLAKIQILARFADLEFTPYAYKTRARHALCLYISSQKLFEMDSLTALSLVAAASREEEYEAYEVTESFDNTTGDDKVHYNKGANCYNPFFLCSVPYAGPTTNHFHSPPGNGVRIRAQGKFATARPTREGGGYMEVCVGGELQNCCLVSTKLLLVMIIVTGIL